MIYASDDNGVIGNEGGLPWDTISEDMKWFKSYTSGKIVVMGRATAESLGKALPKRLNFVLSRSKTGEENGFKYVNDINELLKAIPEDRQDDEIIVMGGGEIYRLMEPLSDTIMWTQIHETCDKGDTTYKVFDDNDWHKIAISKMENKTGKDITPKNNDNCTFWCLSRKSRFAKLFESDEHGQVLISKSYEENIVEGIDGRLAIKVRFDYNGMDLTTTMDYDDSDVGYLIRNANFNTINKERAFDLVNHILTTMNQEPQEEPQPQNE
jgi:dihydrofolate reductase